MNSGSLLDSTFEKSIEPAVKPPTSASRPVRALERRQHVVAQLVDQVGRRLRLWRRSRVRLHHRDLARRRDPRRGDRDDAGVCATAARTCASGAALARRRAAATAIVQRAVEARAEALGQQVERRVGARVGGVVAGVAGVEAQRRRTGSGTPASPQRDDRQRPRPRLHGEAPAPPRGLARRPRPWPRAGGSRRLGRATSRGRTTPAAPAAPSATRRAPAAPPAPTRSPART